MSDFYKQEPTTGVEPEAPEKIKLGEKEYSQDELQKLVGLGEIGAELESKWKTPISEVYKGFTQKSQKLAEIEPEWQQLKRAKEEAERTPQPGAPTQEEKEMARKALVELLGGEVVRKDEFEQLFSQREAAKGLLEDVKGVISEAKELGKPETSQEALLQYMQETGVRNPAKAYRLMFEEQIDKWNIEQLNKARPSTLFTQTGSSAGSKQPQQTRITKDNLTSMLSEVIGRE